MKKIIHIEHDGKELQLKLENVGIKEIGTMFGDVLDAVCNDKRMLGDNSSADAKDVLMNILFTKLGYCTEEAE